MFRSLVRVTRFFTAITQQIFPKLKDQFLKQGSLKSLGQYLTSENRQKLFELIIQSRISPQKANQALEQLTELCGADSDEQLNMIVNILKQKGINYSRIGNIPSSISEFQQAVSTINLMSNPDQIVLSQIYKFIGDLYVQLGQLKKAQKSLLDAENLLKGYSDGPEEDNKIVHAGLACIYTQLSMINYRQKKPIEAYQTIQKALIEWEKVPTKFLQEYELTCRLKCMIHVLFKQNQQAINTASHFLTFMSESPQFNRETNKKKFLFTKLYYLNILCNSKEKPQSQQKQIIEILNIFKKDRGEEKLIQLMIMVGIKPDRYKL